MFSNEKTWNDANTACQLNGGYLASVHGSSSNRMIQQLFSDMSSENIGIWLGFTYVGPSGGYQWVDQSQFSYTNWAKDEPSGSYDGSGKI